VSWRLAAAVLATLALAGCGGGASGLTPSEQNQLFALIGKARTAAAAGNPDAAQTALGQLRARITHLHLAGALDAPQAARMQTAASQAQSAARAQRATAAPAVTPIAPAPKTAPKVVAPPSERPTQIVIQTADGLRNRVKQSVDQGVARLKDQLARLRSRLPGVGSGGGGGH
jgi:hypothetical protein